MPGIPFVLAREKVLKLYAALKTPGNDLK